jgi:hypothetical protein
MNIETIELDANTKQALEDLNARKQELLKSIAQLDEIAQIILTTVINVKELKGEWSLGANMKLIKAPEFTTKKGGKE